MTVALCIALATSAVCAAIAMACVRVSAKSREAIDTDFTVVDPRPQELVRGRYVDFEA